MFFSIYDKTINSRLNCFRKNESLLLYNRMRNFFRRKYIQSIKKSKIYRQEIRQISNTKQIKIYQLIDFVQLFDIRCMTNRS